jgi:hypothetical protein
MEAKQPEPRDDGAAGLAAPDGGGAGGGAGSEEQAQIEEWLRGRGFGQFARGVFAWLEKVEVPPRLVL